MKHDTIVSAYDKAGPAPGTEARIWQKIEGQMELEEENTPRRHPLLRRALLAAACLAMLAGLLTAGYAAYEKWKLPAPVPYTPDTEHGNVRVHTEQRYSLPPQTEAAAPGESAVPSEEPEALSDLYFIEKARSILSRAGVPGPEAGEAAVRRQTHLYWNREEAEVSWRLNDIPYSVTFDAQTGVFIGMDGIDWVIEDAAACSTQAQADELARRYYESLPVEQGYVMRSCEKYDEQFWSYDFCREVEPGLFSWYECVRVAINPVSGALVNCRVFYVPLLDDHQPGDVPLTEAQALEAIRSAGFDPEGWDTATVEKTVGLPNWNFTDQMTIDAQAPAVSRLCWSVTLYVGPDENTPFSTETRILVDYYTGEILGGDTTG